MTSLSMRGPSCWSTTPASKMPVCGQTKSCTHECTQNSRGPGFPTFSTQWHTPQRGNFLCMPVATDTRGGA